jgi:hypothetical protein
LWLKTSNHRCNDILLRKALDITDLGAVTMFNQSDSNTIATSTTGTSDAMGIVFWFHW